MMRKMQPLGGEDQAGMNADRKQKTALRSGRCSWHIEAALETDLFGCPLHSSIHLSSGAGCTIGTACQRIVQGTESIPPLCKQQKLVGQQLIPQPPRPNHCCIPYQTITYKPDRLPRKQTASRISMKPSSHNQSSSKLFQSHKHWLYHSQRLPWLHTSAGNTILIRCMRQGPQYWQYHTHMHKKASHCA